MALVIVGLWVGILFMLVKFGVLKKWHLWMKLSPIVVLIGVLCILAIPMNWGAPSGPVTVYQYVTPIAPAVSGQVESVEAESFAPIKEGEVLFRIDPTKHKAEVDRLEAALAEAKQDVLQLKSAFEAAQSSVKQATAVRDLAKLTFEKASALKKANPAAMAGLQVDQAELSLAESNASLQTAAANLEKARLAYTSEINGEQTAVVQLRAQLEIAKFDLANCDVRAPADGFVPGVVLQEGQFVNAGDEVLALVQSNRVDFLVRIPQNGVRHIQMDQPAEIVLDAYPGRTFTGKVKNILLLTPEGQLTANNKIMVELPDSDEKEPIVEISIDEGQIEYDKLSGGMVGQAAIYTNTQAQSHLYRKVALRMRTWLNYVLKH